MSQFLFLKTTKKVPSGTRWWGSKKKKVNPQFVSTLNREIKGNLIFLAYSLAKSKIELEEEKEEEEEEEGEKNWEYLLVVPLAGERKKIFLKWQFGKLLL